ncbi:MAG: hypothetical protein QMD13_09375 [Candidatus Bathyarchaeia archaeon]|nr:hypothetical protein [Candidatus Bathyarchaeia archaeon]
MSQAKMIEIINVFCREFGIPDFMRLAAMCYLEAHPEKCLKIYNRLKNIVK